MQFDFDISGIFKELNERPHEVDNNSLLALIQVIETKRLGGHPALSELKVFMKIFEARHDITTISFLMHFIQEADLSMVKILGKEIQDLINNDIYGRSFVDFLNLFDVLQGIFDMHRNPLIKQAALKQLTNLEMTDLFVLRGVNYSDEIKTRYMQIINEYMQESKSVPQMWDFKIRQFLKEDIESRELIRLQVALQIIEIFRRSGVPDTRSFFNSAFTPHHEYEIED